MSVLSLPSTTGRVNIDDAYYVASHVTYRSDVAFQSASQSGFALPAYVPVETRELTSTVLSRLFEKIPYKTESAPRHNMALRCSKPRMWAVRDDQIRMAPLGFVDGLRIDVDTPDAINAWREAGLPPPTYAVENPANGHAHLTWLFKIWVNLNNPVQKKFFEDVRYGFRNALDADKGFSGTEMTSSPWSERYRVHVFTDTYYTLKDLRKALPRFIYPVSDGKHSYHSQCKWEPPGMNCFIFWRAERFSKKLIRLGRFPDDAMRRDVSDFMHDLLSEAERRYPNSDQYTGDEHTASLNSVMRRRRNAITRHGCRVIAPEIRRLEKAVRKRLERGSDRSREVYTSDTNERRQKVKELAANGIGATEIARQVGISRQEVYRLQKPLTGRISKNVESGSESVTGCRSLQGYVITRDTDIEIKAVRARETMALNAAMVNLQGIFRGEPVKNFYWLLDPNVCSCGLTGDLLAKREVLFEVESARLALRNVVRDTASKTLILHHESPELIRTKVTPTSWYRPKFADAALSEDCEDPFSYTR